MDLSCYYKTESFFTYIYLCNGHITVSGRHKHLVRDNCQTKQHLTERTNVTNNTYNLLHCE